MKLPSTIYLGHRKIKVKEIGARTANKDEIYGDFKMQRYKYVCFGWKPMRIHAS